jgi:hypothetical protein
MRIKSRLSYRKATQNAAFFHPDSAVNDAVCIAVRFTVGSGITPDQLSFAG